MTAIDHAATAQTLNKAADLIEERGWGRGNVGMVVDGPHCLEGAIQAAAGGSTYVNWHAPLAQSDPPIGAERYDYAVPSLCPATQAVKDYLADRGVRRPFEWNDQKGRTAAEVIEVLRAAAAIEQSRADADPLSPAALAAVDVRWVEPKPAEVVS